MRGLVLSVVGILAASPVPAAGEDDPRILLERMEHAIESLNYEGTFVHIVDGQVDTMYVVHRVEDGVATERLVSLDGAQREIIRKQDKVTCIFADKKSVLVEKRQDGGPIRSAIPRYTTSLDAHYIFDLKKPTHKLGRDAAVMEIVPQDEHRYGYKLWMDKATGMMLKSQVVDKYGKVLEQLIFVSIELPESIPADRLEPSIATEKFTWYVQEEEGAVPAGDRAATWRAGSLPAGFELHASKTQVMAGEQVPTEHLVYSDGIASVSVFVDSAPEESDETGGPSRIGAANAYTTRVSGHVVTAMGEVPAETVRMIARSMRPVPGTPVASQ
jgi:sigma-E factor negative regulatory protein RseB